MPRRDPSVYNFWDSNSNILQAASKEWAETNEEAVKLPILHDSLYRQAFAEAWKDPSMQYLVQDLRKEVAPGVYQCQFFDPDKLHKICAYLDKAAEAGIPTRPPHGSVLNRKGVMIHPRSVGFLAIPEFQYLYRHLIDTPTRVLWAVFSILSAFMLKMIIQYQGGKDQSIR